MKKIKVGIIQQSNTADIRVNLMNLAKSIEACAAHGAQLIVLQELHNSLYFCQTENTNLFDLAEPIPGPSTGFYSELAAANKVVLVTSLFEKRAPGLYHNTAVVFDRDGSIAGKYRKMHIPDDPAYYEKFYFTPGDIGFEPIQTSLGKLGVGYVAEKNEGRLWVRLHPDDGAALAAGTEIIRLGRAATQLDVQSPQFSVLPQKKTNFCQIFKMQIEQSMVMKLSHKEVGWDFTDQQEAAVYDMRLGMEKQFLFGKRMKVYDYLKQENVTLTEGVWTQAGKEIHTELATLDAKALVDILRKTFTENSGSRRKILIAGSDLIAAINKIDAQRVITARDQVTAWGIDFSELISKFGRLYVVFSDVFDSMGMAANGIIIDPEYIQKHVFIPFNAERLDLRGSGQRNTEALVLTEASCLTLRYPEAHARVIGG